MNTRLIAFTRLHGLTHPDTGQALESPEALIVYAARVSNPNNQLNIDTGGRLLRYCMRHGHWSVFETASMTVEVETSRAIAAQILRHRSFTFQEFSQRYAPATRLGSLTEIPELRPASGGGNRQGSDEVNQLQHPHALRALVTNHLASGEDLYARLLEEGVAPECARMVLPLCTRTRLYMTGSCRSWIHYFQQRCDSHAQKEHREVATQIRDVHFAAVFPITHALLLEAAAAA